MINITAVNTSEEYGGKAGKCLSCLGSVEQRYWEHTGKIQNLNRTGGVQ